LNPGPATISYLFRAPLLEKRFVFFPFLCVSVPTFKTRVWCTFRHAPAENIRPPTIKRLLYFPCSIFQPSTVVGRRGLRGRRAARTAVITEPGLARLRVRRTVAVTAWAEIRRPATVREDLVSVNNNTCQYLSATTNGQNTEYMFFFFFYKMRSHSLSLTSFILFS